MKTCTKCGTRKALSEYYVNIKMKDGHYNHCKECHSQYYKRRYESRKKKEKKYHPEIVIQKAILIYYGQGENHRQYIGAKRIIEETDSVFLSRVVNEMYRNGYLQRDWVNKKLKTTMLGEETLKILYG